jgi:putative transposase
VTAHNPFKFFKTSPNIIRLAVMYYVRYPLSFRQVEDVLYERGIDIWVLSDQLDVPLVGT